MDNYFDDSEYYSRLFPQKLSSDENIENERAKINAISDGRLEEAYKQAADIRKFEIGLFWKRGTYYWAFILAAFTTHFALLGMIFSTFSEDINKSFSLENMCKLPGLSLFSLDITAFFCFFFSLAWTLVNKGSKFWQKNWEAHIDNLEESVTGKLHETYLNTDYEGSKKDFDKCPFNPKAYDYSVTRITMITSILLTIVSIVLVAFYSCLLFFKTRDNYTPLQEHIKWIFIPIFILGLLLFTLVALPKFSKSSNFESTKNRKDKWYQRIDS